MDAALWCQRFYPDREEIVTPLRWEPWDYFLVNHSDQEYCRYIVTGLRGLQNRF